MSLKKLVSESTWIFEDAFIELYGNRRAVKDVYQEAMGNLALDTGGSRQQAKFLFRLIIADAPVFAEGYFQTARLELFDGNIAEAADLAAGAAELAPGNANYRILNAALIAATDGVLAASREIQALCSELRTAHPEFRLLDSSDPEQMVTAFLAKFLHRVLPGYVFFDDRLTTEHDIVLECVERLASAPADGNFESDAGFQLAEKALMLLPNLHTLRFYAALKLRDAGAGQAALKLLRVGEGQSHIDWRCAALSGCLVAEAGDRTGALAHFDQAALDNHNIPILDTSNLSEAEAAKAIEWFKALLTSAPPHEMPAAPWRYPSVHMLRRKQYQDSRQFSTLLALAAEDISQSAKHWQGWWALARNDIASRYRRTVLGPWWIVTGTGLALVGMSLVWSIIFDLKMNEFFPYVASGYVIWMFISAILMESPSTFIDGHAAAIQKNLDPNKSIHVARIVARNFLVFLHTICIYVVGAVIFKVEFTWSTLLVLPGYAILLVTAPAVALVFGIIGARFRDFGPAIGAVMTVLFLLTPVLWKIDMLGSRGALALVNPLTHYIAIVREPMLGLPPDPLSYAVTICLSVLIWIIALLLFIRFRSRLIYWL